MNFTHLSQSIPVGLIAALTVALTVAFTAAGCAGPSPRPQPPESASEIRVVDDYPTLSTPDGREVYEPPFSAAEIREATPDGTVQRVVMTREGKRYLVRVAFERSDEKGVFISNTPIDSDGEALSEANASYASWYELERHAWFDAATTTVARTTVSTEMGIKDAIVFSTRRDPDIVSHVWFALDMPGAPVLIEEYRDGDLIMKLEIVDRHSGSPTP